MKGRESLGETLHCPHHAHTMPPVPSTEKKGVTVLELRAQWTEEIHSRAMQFIFVLQGVMYLELNSDT